VNLRDFEYLVALAEYRHFGRAADACYVSQPTLSTQIKKLEAELGVELFERTPRRLGLTPAGQKVLERAQIILAETNNIRSIALNAQDPESGVFRLGIFPTLGPYLLPHVVPALHERFPNLELLLVEEKTEELLSRLENGDLEAIIVALPIANYETLERRYLFTEDFVLAVNKSHPLAEGDSLLNPSILNQEVLLLLEEGHCLRDQALEVCSLTGATERTGFRATSLETLRQMVVANVGITLMPRLAVSSPSTASDQVRLRNFADPVPHRNLALLWRPTSIFSPLMSEIGDLIAKLPDGLVRYAPPAL